MQIAFQVKLSPGLYLRNPESSELGKQLIEHSIHLIASIGYENFTFKKLAAAVPTTEASVYRYFENKHKLLIYLVDLYWSLIEFQVMYSLNNVVEPKQKIKKIIDLLVWEDNQNHQFIDLDQKALYYIAIAEGSKAYLSKDVDLNNKEFFYKPYKDLCHSIAKVLLEYKPNYKYAHSLASSIVEMSHTQFYFMHHLPKLCDFSESKDPKEIEAYLEHLVFGALA